MARCEICGYALFIDRHHIGGIKNRRLVLNLCPNCHNIISAIHSFRIVPFRERDYVKQILETYVSLAKERIAEVEEDLSESDIRVASEHIKIIQGWIADPSSGVFHTELAGRVCEECRRYGRDSISLALHKHHVRDDHGRTIRTVILCANCHRMMHWALRKK
jgi:hypothetical protein